MKIEHLRNPALSKPLAPTRPAVEGGSSVSGSFEKMLESTNQQLLDAESKQQEFVTSGTKDIHGTMIQMEESEMAMRLLLQVRNKLTNAYEEVMRMPV